MNQKHLTSAFAICLAVLTILASCMTVSKYVSQARMNTAIVPEDFNPSRHILLVAEMPRLNNPEERNNSVTEKLDKALKEYCPYKYEIVSQKDIYDNKEKYGDTSVYKYAILNSLNSVRNTTTTSFITKDQSGRTTNTNTVAPSARTTYIDFGFYNRVDNTRYSNSGNATTHIDYTIAAFIAVIKKVKGK